MSWCARNGKQIGSVAGETAAAGPASTAQHGRNQQSSGGGAANQSPQVQLRVVRVPTRSQDRSEGAGGTGAARNAAPALAHRTEHVGGDRAAQRVAPAKTHESEHASGDRAGHESAPAVACTPGTAQVSVHRREEGSGKALSHGVVRAVMAPRPGMTPAAQAQESPLRGDSRVSQRLSPGLQAMQAQESSLSDGGSGVCQHQPPATHTSVDREGRR